MPIVNRFDSGTLAAAEKLDNGWLRVDGRTARVGILTYPRADGTFRRELVLPEELFEPESMASASMVPVTNQHPAALLDHRTARGHQVGSVGENLRADGEYLAAPLLVTDGDTVRAIEEGRQQLSWGYDCDLGPRDAKLVPVWGEHDGIQRRRRYNHLAIVDEARAGEGASLRLDSADERMIAFAAPAPSSPREPESRHMAQQIKIGSHRFDSTEASASLIQQAIDRELGEVTARLDALTAEKAKLEGERATSSKRFDALKGRVASRLKGIKGRIDAMKARMMGCDECGGEGKVMDGEEQKSCAYCDGAGKIRMTDAIRAMPMAEGEEEGHPEDDLAEVEEEAEDGLEREPATEEGLERTANPEHKDRRRDAAKKRADARAALRKKRADSLDRRADRRAAERASLMVSAQRHLGADERLDGKSDGEIMRAVLARIAPHLDAAKLPAEQVSAFYAAELARLDGSGGAQPSAADLVRGGVGAPAARSHGGSPELQLAEARARRDARNSGAWQRKTDKK